jgi:hypothetical protein
MPRSYKWSRSFRFTSLAPSDLQTKTVYLFLCFSIRATCLVHLILDLIILIVFSVEKEMTKLFITQCSTIARSFLPYRLNIIIYNVDSANCLVEKITLDFVTFFFAFIINRYCFCCSFLVVIFVTNINKKVLFIHQLMHY